MMKLDCFAGAGADIIQEVCREIIEGWQVKIQLARAKQARLKAQRDRLEGYALEGIGQKILSVDRESYMYWGTREGWECWEDDEFVREYARDNETARVAHLKRTNVVTVAAKTWQQRGRLDDRLHRLAVRKGEDADAPRVLPIDNNLRVKEDVA